MREPSDRERRVLAASDFSTNLVVTAGAGSGKTSLLVERILHLVLERETPLERVAAITFTVKAASELRDRVEDALDRIIELCRGGAVSGREVGEADRVFGRLKDLDPSRAAERAERALDSLDAASIGTIHSFAADILRRHHRLAGVDPAFEVDEGEAWNALFEEAWPKFLEENLGPGKDPGPWGRPLARLSLEALETLARELAAFGVPREAFGEGAAALQKLAARVHGRARLHEIRGIREAVRGARGANRNLPRQLAVLEGAFSRYAEEGDPPRPEDFEGLPKGGPDLGKNYAGPRKDELQAALRRIASEAKRLAEWDPSLFRDVLACLRPFADRLRREYLERGYVSYDAIVLLARDLLRDHPEVRREEARRFDAILVDEFQDTDPVQYEIVFFLAAKVPRSGSDAPRDAFRSPLEPGKLFIVGDAKQSIYHFRGADIRAYKRAVDAIARGGREPIELSANFRSAPEIVRPLNDLFRAQFPPATGGSGSGVGAAGFDPEFQGLEPVLSDAGEPRIEIWSVGEGELSARRRRELEAEIVAAEIAERLGRGEFRLQDVAILLRAFSELDIYLRALRARRIPYIVDGGKGFLRRYEVELLLAFLRAVTTPADAVSLVACLRSPALAVPDEELRRYAAAARKESGGDRHAVWSLSAEPDAREFPHLARALELLRSVAREARGSPIDRLARKVCDEIPLRLAMAASYEGAQRVANLDKALRRIARLAGEGRLTDAEILESVEEREAAGIDEGDSALSDETVEAVRVLTIHKAKGLEWPVVILPDIARWQEPPRSDDRVGIVSVEAEGAAGSGFRGPALAVRVGSFVTPARFLEEDEERAHEAAESRRLLYVATTRAKERLVLVVGAPKKKTRSWVDALAAWGYAREGGAPPEEESFAGGAVLHRKFLEAPKVPRAPREAGADTKLLEAARAYEEAVRKLSGRKAPAVLRPSALEGPPEDRSLAPLDGEAAEPRLGDPPEREVALAAGTAAHLLLELWEGGDPAWLSENAPRAAAIAAAEAEIDPGTVLAELRKILERAEKSGRLQALAALGPIAREVPLLFRGDGGEVWDGVIDAVAGSAEEPRVVDYKTSGDPASPDELRRRYAGQLGLYARAVAAALGLASPVPADVEPL
ncbi:MAG: UvrD-helicase domain-containing protein [Planctomycetota bacterium]